MNVKRLTSLYRTGLLCQPIYYYHRNGDTYPGVVRSWAPGRKRVKIRYDSLRKDDVIAYVDPARIELQFLPPQPEKVMSSSKRIPNLHLIEVRYHGPTNHRGARMSMRSHRFDERPVIIERDYETRDVLEQAWSYLEARGMVPISECEMRNSAVPHGGSNAGGILCVTFKPIPR